MVKSHKRTVLSPLPVASQWLSGLKATAGTRAVCSRKTRGVLGLGAVRSQRYTVPSQFPAATQRLFELMAMALIWTALPFNIRGAVVGSGAVRSHMEAVPFRLPVTNQCLSGLVPETTI